MKLLDKILGGSEFRKNVAILMTGTTLAQFIPFAISPVLTRLYNPDDFGGLALFVSISTILGILSTGKYDGAILLPKENDKAELLFSLSIVISTFLFGVLTCLTVLSYVFFSDQLQLGGLHPFLWLLPFMVFSMGTYQSGYYLLNRDKGYKLMSVSRVVQNLMTGIISVILGLLSFSAIGLVFSKFVGQVSSAIVVFRVNYKRFAFDKRELKAVAIEYIRFPKFIVLSQFVNVGSLQLPVLMLSALFGSYLLGFFALTQRVIMTPIAILSSAVGDVFRQEASQQFSQNQNCREVYVATLKKLFFISIVPFIIFYFAAPGLFALIFGEEWAMAGSYAQILTPMFFFQILGRPLSSIFLVTHRQKLELMWQVVMFILTILPFALSYLISLSIESTLIILSITRCISYTLLLLIGFQIARNG